MAKTNNKGFTLIEIVIAVAILSVLLTPILKQFADTLETSRKAKALQEANETAVYEVEEFQTLTRDELEKKYNAPTVHENLPVKMYDLNGTEISSDLKYNAYVYKLNDQKIGAKKDVYSNVVILDDLSNKVRAYDKEGDPKHYKIAYGLTDTELAKFGSDFKLTNEGSIVQYDENGFIKAIACTDKNKEGNTDVSYVQNPNEVNLGNMQNLDKNTTALVLGGTTSFDSDAFSALFSKAMDHLRELDYESWQQALLNVDNQSILSQNSMSNSKRLIKVYADQITDSATGKDCYVVKVDVYYDYHYDLSVEGKGTKSYHDMITYTVFSQKFFTKEPPSIYFEYQPYCISGANSADAVYQKDDYILFDNYVDECKLYLYKPYKDQQNANAKITDYYTVDTDGDGIADKKQPYYTYYTDKNEKTKVKIHLASKNDIKPIELDKDDKPTKADAYKRVYIFTNLDTTGYDKGDGTAQFVSDAYKGTFDYVKGEKDKRSSVEKDVDAVYNKYALGNNYPIVKTQADGSVKNDKEQVLYKLSEDTREAERLFTITVKLEPTKKNLNTVRLSGAKGAN